LQPSDFEAAAALVRARINAIFAHGKIRGEHQLHDIFPISLTPERCRVLSLVCGMRLCQATLEIGMGWGISTLVILEAMLRQGRPFAPHVVIDPFQRSSFDNAAINAVREMGLADFVTLYEEPSELVLPQLVRAGSRFDFVFVDGDHRFDATFVDFVYAGKLCNPGAILLFDDTWLESVNLTVQYALTNLNYAEVSLAGVVPFYRGRPMLRALVKPAEEPPRNGLWTEELIPFWTNGLGLDMSDAQAPGK